MNTLQTINIGIAETSLIVRSGLVAVLKRLTDIKVLPTEISSIEGLQHCLKGHDLDIIFINPAFEGWFNIKEFKTKYAELDVKYVAILCSVTDRNLIKEYDEVITLYDDEKAIGKKISKLMNFDDENGFEEQESLSDREKEIICYVVKGMTNKEIAEHLYISVHTVITHRRNISKKLQIHSSAGLTIYAIVNKLVELKEVKL